MEVCGQTMIPRSSRQNGATQDPLEYSSRAPWAGVRAAAQRSLRPEISNATSRTSPNTRWEGPRQEESPRHKPPASMKARSPASSRFPLGGNLRGKHESISLEQRSSRGHLDVVEKLPRALWVL